MNIRPMSHEQVSKIRALRCLGWSLNRIAAVMKTNQKTVSYWGGTGAAARADARLLLKGLSAADLRIDVGLEEFDTTVARDYSGLELTDAERNNLLWADITVYEVVKHLGFNPLITAADFVGRGVWGTWTPDQIRIARHILTDHQRLISTVVHEVAHYWGLDGTDGHLEAMQRIFGAIIARQPAQLTRRNRGSR